MIFFWGALEQLKPIYLNFILISTTFWQTQHAASQKKRLVNLRHSVFVEHSARKFYTEATENNCGKDESKSQLCWINSQADELIYYSGEFDQIPVVILVMHKKSPAIYP